MKSDAVIGPMGDCSVVVRLGRHMDEELTWRITGWVSVLERNPFPGFVEAVPAYTSLTVYYDPLKVMEGNRLYVSRGAFAQDDMRSPYDIVREYLAMLILREPTFRKRDERLVRLPVCYGGAFGPDLAEVAEYADLRPEEVIRLHSEKEYPVYMLGFAPGFPYLGGVDDRLAIPRKLSPRLRVPAGSVGIAGKQTGVYPLETPGGWQIIGRTPAALFRPAHHPPTLLQAGDRVRFEPITAREYSLWKEEPL